MRTHRSRRLTQGSGSKGCTSCILAPPHNGADPDARAWLRQGSPRLGCGFTPQALVHSRGNAINDTADCRVIRIAFVEVLAELLDDVCTA